MVERDMSDGCDACLSRVGRAAFRLKRSTFSLPEDSPRVFESSSGRGDQGAFEDRVHSTSCAPVLQSRRPPDNPLTSDIFPVLADVIASSPPGADLGRPPKGLPSPPWSTTSSKVMHLMHFPVPPK